MITVFGYLGRPSPALREAAASAGLVVGGARHLDALGVPDGKRVVLADEAAGGHHGHRGAGPVRASAGGPASDGRPDKRERRDLLRMRKGRE